MRRRILMSTLLVVALTALLLGVPLMFTTWRLVDDVTTGDLAARLDRVAADLTAQEGDNNRIDGVLDTDRLGLALPAGGRLQVTYPDGNGAMQSVVIGAPEVANPVVQVLDLGRTGSLELQVPSDGLRTTQLQAMAVVLVVILVATGGGALISTITARRLAGPLMDVAHRAARLGSGDFRADPTRYDIAELDRVSDVLDSSAAELAALVRRERELVGDVSHQLRSRLTAVRLRLDELADHADPVVVEEAAAALAQVDRLTNAINDMVTASRAVRTSAAGATDAARVLHELVAEWEPLYTDAGRVLRVDVPESATARVNQARLRETVGVLLDNALAHGAGEVRLTMRLVPGRLGPGSDSFMEPTALIEVADEGPGVPDELVRHVFERGFSGADSTGVGLALARSLAETDGGRLELRRARPPVFALFLTVPHPDGEPGPEPTLSQRPATVAREPR
ncbi:HAMP domain-containing sensor histidine kinase [Rhodococcus sp. X156]|uniref:sensor histidine kinase n=1 Tax=Rhodococcus sp. X156 TaxID=2499145 RepID=UPI000FDA563D|nr:HAMP domain-containing sensor histidine kinase [Rhodococcus sp. X156]